MLEQQAPDLPEAEIRLAVARCPEELRWAFAGWLYGTHTLAGDPVTECPSCHVRARPHTDYCRYRNRHLRAV